jgi:hypothetical protein
MNITKQIMMAALMAATVIEPALGDVVIDLKTGNVTDTKAGPVQTVGGAPFTSTYVNVAFTKSAACKETQWEAVATINYKPTVPAGVQEMKVAGIDVTFEGPSTGAPNLPTGWVTHIGDDANNDGYGGGSTADGGVAEGHITNQQMLVYSAALDIGIVEKIVQQDLQPGSGSVYFEVGNQWLSWGNPYNEVDSLNTKKLFQIPDKFGDYKVYLGLNRVISNRTDRKGCGARRAVISLR